MKANIRGWCILKDCMCFEAGIPSVGILYENEKTAVFLRTQRRKKQRQIVLGLEGQLQSELDHARSAQVEYARAGQDASGVVLYGRSAVDRARS